MKELGFLKRARPEWAKLENYASRLGRLSTKELLEFVSLYRRATSDLARARTLKLRNEVVDYLNRLVGRIHFQIYTTPHHSGRLVVDFFARTLPQAVRRNGGYVVASILLLVIPAVLGYAAVAVDPRLIRVFAPPQFVELIDKYGSIEQRGPGEMAAYTSFYIANNVQVSFLTFVGGILFGLGSIFLLINNGAILGGMLAGVAAAGQSRPFLSFISTHGGIEMFAIVLAGAAGLRLGATMFNPGELRRGDAMKTAGRDAGVIMLGVVSMLLIAAMLEAWISPSKIPDPVKWVAGIVNLGLVAAYVTMAGRDRRKAAREPAAP